MKPIHGVFRVKELSPLQTVPMGTAEGIPLTHQPMDPLCKELPGLLLEPLHHYYGLYIFVQPESMALYHFLDTHIKLHC
jgi:hypothetical protein